MREEQLHEGRDLALTTDFRQVLSELVRKQMGTRELAVVFPGFMDYSFRNVLNT
jgi:uncharacterized protein (DUF1501 family)